MVYLQLDLANTWCLEYKKICRNNSVGHMDQPTNMTISMTFTAGILLLCLAASNAMIDQTLDETDQQLDLLTYRVTGLSQKLDNILGDNKNAEIQGERLAKRLDRQRR